MAGLPAGHGLKMQGALRSGRPFNFSAKRSALGSQFKLRHYGAVDAGSGQSDGHDDRQIISIGRFPASIVVSGQSFHSFALDCCAGQRSIYAK
jgi:hypothetical protein